jgi:hypothetical protein
MFKEMFVSTWITITILCQVLNVSSGDNSRLLEFSKPSIEIEVEPVDTMKLFFHNYETDAQVYLDRDVFSGTPITGKILSTCEKNTYDSTGVIVPLELALSQAQWESGMGRFGKSAKCNPYNVGEWDRGTMWKYSTTEEGVQAYFNLIAKDYLSNKSVDQLLINFVNDNGHRYASSTSYENHIGGTYKDIKNWIETSS